MSDHPCPNCGKPMIEQPKFPGLWMCPDGAIIFNGSPPFRRLCEGMEVTDEAVELFNAEIQRRLAERN